MANISMFVWNDFRNDSRVLKEAETLVASGNVVTVFALSDSSGFLKSENLSSGINVVRVRRGFSLPKSLIKHKAYIFFVAAMRFFVHAKIFCMLARSRSDVIHTHDVNTLPTAWLASTFSSAKLIYDAHEISTSREGYKTLRKLVGGIEKRITPKVDGMITTTDARAKFFARAYRIKRPVVLQNRPRLQACMQSNRIREELKLRQPWPIIVYQGGVQSGRGLERLARVAADVPNAYFVFVGGGRLEGSLRSIVFELGLEERVHFIPTVPLAELPSYTASADIGVQPIENTCLNHYTTDSNKLFEYVQAGLPVVASDLPEIRRVVRAHDLGLLIPAGNSEALTMALNELVADEGKRKYYATQSRKAAAVLNWESQEHELLALYGRVLSDSASV